MKIIEINIGTDIEKIIQYKGLIVNSLLEQKLIKRDLTLEEFVEYLDLSKQIFIEKAKNTLPFSLYNLDDESLLFFYTNDKDGLKDRCLEKLALISYNVVSLVEKTDADIIDENIEENSYFIINNKFYGMPED